MTRLNRTTFLAAGAALLATRERAGAQSLVKLRIASPPNSDFVMAVYAQKSGIFRKYGLDADITIMASGSAAAAAMVGGSLELARSSTLSLIEAHARGLHFVIVSPSSTYNTDAPTSGLVVLKDGPIRSGADLNGKVVSVPAVGDLDTIATSGWIDQNGGDSRTVKFLGLPHRAAPEALLSGRIAACNLPEPNLTDALNTGKCRILGKTLDGIGKHFISTAYFCTSEYALANPDILARFRKALYESAAYANAHNSQMWPLIAQFTNVDETTVATMPWETLPTSIRDLDPSMIQPLIDTSVKYKAIAAPFPAKEMIDPTLAT
jgi:NitT/TauT family transport system substrate-binding protein